MAQPTILLVDRNRNVLSFLRREFEDQGYIVYCVSSAKDALGFINQENHPDLIIVDPDLPMHEGLDLLEKILNRLPPLPVIVHSRLDDITAYPVLDKVEAIMEKGEDVEKLSWFADKIVRQKDKVMDVLKPVQGGIPAKE